jgi:hypothetical protein
MPNSRKYKGQDVIRNPRGILSSFDAGYLMDDLSNSWPIQSEPTIDYHKDHYLGRPIMESKRAVKALRTEVRGNDDLFDHRDKLVLPLMRRHGFFGVEGGEALGLILEQLHETFPQSKENLVTTKVKTYRYNPAGRHEATVLGIELADPEPFGHALEDEFGFIEGRVNSGVKSPVFCRYGGIMVRAVETSQSRTTIGVMRGMLNTKIMDGRALTLGPVQICQATAKNSNP